MFIRNSGLALAGLSLTAFGLLAMPLGAHAQGDQGGTDTSAEAAGPKIKLDLENADLYTALKLLFAQTKSQYTLDPSLRNIFVTVHISQPFRNALETLLRASGQPLTYKVENEVYSIVPKTEDTTPDTTETTEPIDKPQTVNLKKYFSTRFKYNTEFLLTVLHSNNLIRSMQIQNGQGGGFGGGGFGGGGMGGFGGGGLGGGFGGGGMGGGFGGMGGGFGGGGLGGGGFGGGGLGGGFGGGGLGGGLGGGYGGGFGR